MNFKFRLIYLSFSVLIILTLCSCGKTKINSAEDEIKLYNWSYSESDIEASLAFDGNTAVLELESSGETCRISGICVFTDSSFVISDDEISENFLFGYNLRGNNLEIIYSDSTLCFKKQG